MASIESRNGNWRVIFRHNGKKRHFTIGEISTEDAALYKASTEELLRLLQRNLVGIPTDCTIEEFMFHRGKPPAHVAITSNGANELTLSDLQEAYLRSQEKKLEQTTLDGIRLHFSHLNRILGCKAVIALLRRPDIQRYVDKRTEEWIDPNVYRKARREQKATAKPGRKFWGPRDK